MTDDGRIVKLSLAAPFSGRSCLVPVSSIDLRDDGEFVIDFASQAGTSAEGFLRGKLGETTASGEYRVYVCGKDWEENPTATWQAEWESSDMPASIPTLKPTARQVYLSSLTPTYVSVGFGEYSVGTYAFTSEDPTDNIHEGDAIVMHGVAYPHGILAHGPSRIDFDLGDNDYEMLTATVGLLDWINCGNGATFVVLVDGEEWYRSPAMLGQDEPQSVEVPIFGSRGLSLIVDDNGELSCDMAVWGDPILTE